MQVRLKTFIQVRLKTLMHTQKMCMSVGLKTFMQVQTTFIQVPRYA